MESPDRSAVHTTSQLYDWRRLAENPNAFADGSTAVELVETHISWVFLTDQYVYKVKKPVSFSFLDYSTSELRRQACCEEVRLNRRLAADVYLDVLPIAVRDDGTIEIGVTDGTIIEYCVKMRRLPEDRMLDYLLRRHLATSQHIDRIVDVLIPFYSRDAARGADVDAFARPAAIEQDVRDNLAVFEELGSSLHAPVDRIRSSQLQFTSLSAAVFERRIREGRIREGHGDLRPEHICLVDPPAIFDCVEFSKPLRCADVLSELVFLATECEMLGASDLAAMLLARYQQRSGDVFPQSLAAFYQAYRACIRAKVDLLRASQLTGEKADQCRARANRYLQLASFHAADFHRPILVVMVGAAATGKSTIGRALAEQLGAKVLRTDVIRQALAGRREPGADVEQGIYAPAMTERTYEKMMIEASDLLNDSISVVLDGSFTSPDQRDRARRLAAERGAIVGLLHCTCSRERIAARIVRRRAEQSDASDASTRVSDWQIGRLVKADDLEKGTVLKLDTDEPVAALLAQALSFLAWLRH